MFLKTLIRLAAAAAIIVVLERIGVWIWLVAHPFWSAKGSYIGIAAGIAVSLGISALIAKRDISQWIVLTGVVLLTALIAAITWYGKAEFVASYAENSFAGRIWFFGFMAFIAGCFVTLVELSRLIIGR